MTLSALDRLLDDFTKLSPEFLQIDDLLGNQGSKNSGNSKSITLLSLDQHFINLPSIVQDPQPKKSSVILSTNSYTEADFVVKDPSSNKRSLVCEQTESCGYKFRVREDLFSTSKPNFLDKESCLCTL